MLPELGLPSFNTLIDNYNVSFANRLSACDKFLFNVFYSLTCNVHGALYVIFYFVFCSVGYLLFCLCLCVWFVCFFVYGRTLV